MKIIRGHDYYDSAAQFGIDETVKFIREDRVIDMIFFPPLMSLPREGYRGTDFSPIWVAVGDLLYRGVHYDDRESYMDPDPAYYWSLSAYEALLERNKVKIASSRNRYLSYLAHANKHNVAPVDYFQPIRTPTPLFDRMLAEGLAVVVGEPVPAHRNQIIRGNPDDLKRIEFYKVLDAFTIHQEIEMFVSGVLAGQSPATVEITDNRVKIEKHGFDYRTSFRKSKEQ